MPMKYKDNWPETMQHFKSWWKRESFGRHLMWVTARRQTPAEELETVRKPETPEEFHLDVERKVSEMRNYCRTHIFMAEAFPYVDLNIGPGSLATYLGTEPVFSWDTVWYKECADSLDDLGNLRFDQGNYWWKTHCAMLARAQAASGEDFLVAIPDLIENADSLSAMRGPQNLCYDFVDQPEKVEKYIHQIDDLYFKYYNAMYDIVKGRDGSSCYTAFSIWGPGKTAKVQCDFSALMSPAQFREFILPSLEKQLGALDNSIYHLDGPDAIRHLDALMEIGRLDGLQWTAGAGQPDGGNEKWYRIYDKVKKAGKALWISIYDGEFKDWISSADRLISKYGAAGMYLLFPEMEEDEALTLMEHSYKHWNR